MKRLFHFSKFNEAVAQQREVEGNEYDDLMDRQAHLMNALDEDDSLTMGEKKQIHKELKEICKKIDEIEKWQLSNKLRDINSEIGVFER